VLRLWEWAREFSEGPGGDAAPVEARIVDLAEGWGVTVELARRTSSCCPATAARAAAR